MNENKRRFLSIWLWVALTGLLLFIILVLAIRLPQVLSLDRGLIRLLDPLRSAPLTAWFVWLTDFGATKALTWLLTASVLFLLIRKRLIAPIVLLAAFFSERQLNELLKMWVQRDRPDFPHLVYAGGYSFPSGHAMNAMTVYGLLIVLIAPLIPVKWLKIIWIAACLMMIALIGFSRPFLRVHYFTDILAGYSMGGVVVALSAMMIILIDQRHRSR
ncbi:phosphatase PAP2 family protein [Sporolactobacillus vineae]|uniref:phosphatase PAP2 family protein n=1 Tax=Sporolactobacillus vineae TaxID=444463 RepID=UPI0002883185|nr:phosphatase PAP2 family protein [Sporolactobacillus vineae]